MNELWRVQRENYGPDYGIHLLEQYKLYVEMADRISQRRAAANNYLLTVNAFLVTLYGLASSIPSIQQRGAWIYFVPVAGIVVCLTWLVLIKSHRDLNSVKFIVIHELEQRLPAALYDYEWKLAEQGRGKTYWLISHIEQIIPYVFVLLYALLAVFVLL